MTTEPSTGQPADTSARAFHLGDILTVTTGRLVSPRHVEGVYDILGFMTGESLYTHALPRAMRECQGPLLAQHPHLADVQVPDGLNGKDEVLAWLDTQVARFGETLPVQPLAPVDHTPIDPVAELAMMRAPRTGDH